MKFRHLFIVFFILLLAACGPAETVEETPAATSPSGQEVFPRPTVTPLPPGTSESPAGYPSLPTPRPTQEGYPAPNESTPDAYPALEGFVWMVKPVGLQCEEPQTPTLQDALAELAAANITVNASTTQEFNVCQACGCPTSTHYRVQIPVADQADAEALGWQSIEEP